MRKMLLHLLPLVLVVMLPWMAEAKDYYVNPVSGNNGNDGLTSGTAWKTITYAVSHMSGATPTQYTLYLEAGTYTWTPTTEPVYPISIPSALVNLQIVGAGVGSTVFDPSTSSKQAVRRVV